MFDHRHYVPILRWKRGEWVALREMLIEDRAALTPLIELCPKDFAAWSPQNPQVGNDVLTRKADEIRKNCGHGTLFVDLVHLDHQMPSLCAADGTHALVFLADRVRMREPSFFPDTEPEVIPVTGLDRSSSYQSAVRSVISVDERGVCIRLRGQQLNQPTLPVRLQQLLDFLELEPGEADLIVDLQITDGSGVSLSGICDGLPSLHQWRTFTVASGAFPKDLRGFQVGQHVLARSDWHNWRDGVTNSGALTRLPSFSDYTIQHPIFGEPPEFPNASASVRYTHYDYWVIMRGEGLRNDDGPGFDQYPANELLLCERDEFCGAAFSYGDAYIHGIAEQTTQTGSPETWLRAGINHHMTLVVRQIASLFDSSVVAAL